MKNKRKGFTLIELLVTIAIMAFVVIISFTIIKSAIDRSKTESNNVTISSIAKSALTYTEEFKTQDKYWFIDSNNTNIEYPIVRAKDNEFYLTHSFNKKINSAGWIFADYKNKFDNTDKNIVIYGHNRRDNSMFGSLKKVLKSEWYNNKENEKIILNTEKQNDIYQIFSIYKIEEEDYYIKTEFKNDSEFEKFIQTIKERSIKDFKIDVSKKDSILTLSTCANNNKYRVVVHAKKIIEEE